MSAQLIYDLLPLGSILTYSDGAPRPPERHRKKLTAWGNRNSGGRLIRKQAEARVGNTTILASITLHQGDYGSQGTIVLRVYPTFSVNSDLMFAVKERPAIGSALVLDRAGDDGELVHLAANRAAAEEWLTGHGYRRSKPPEPEAFLAHYRANLAVSLRNGNRKSMLFPASSRVRRPPSLPSRRDRNAAMPLRLRNVDAVVTNKRGAHDEPLCRRDYIPSSRLSSADLRGSVRRGSLPARR